MEGRLSDRRTHQVRRPSRSRFARTCAHGGAPRCGEDFRQQAFDRRARDGLAITPLCDAVFTGTERVVAQEAEHVLLGFLFATDEILRYLGSVALDDGLTLSLLNRGYELEVRRPLTK